MDESKFNNCYGCGDTKVCTKYKPAVKKTTKNSKKALKALIRKMLKALITLDEMLAEDKTTSKSEKSKLRKKLKTSRVAMKVTEFFKVKFCWECGRLFRGKHKVYMKVFGSMRAFHKSCTKGYNQKWVYKQEELES